MHICFGFGKTSGMFKFHLVSIGQKVECFLSDKEFSFYLKKKDHKKHIECFYRYILYTHIKVPFSLTIVLNL